MGNSNDRGIDLTNSKVISSAEVTRVSKYIKNSRRRTLSLYKLRTDEIYLISKTKHNKITFAVNAANCDIDISTNDNRDYIIIRSKTDQGMFYDYNGSLANIILEIIKIQNKNETSIQLIKYIEHELDIKYSRDTYNYLNN